jgi:2-aminoadipate transaminase
MAIILARRMADLRASDIREILKLTQRPEVISFAGGLPAAEVFPVEAMIDLTANVLRREGHRSLQYSTTEGHPPLRRAIARRMNATTGTRVDEDEILITSGSQQGLDLSAKVFLDEGDVVLCESPTYLGAINAFRAYRPRFVEVPTDDEGMNIEALERLVAHHERVKMVYVIPNFQNPTGRTWSLRRRRGLIEVASRWQLPVIEDNPYGEVRFAGEAVLPLKALDGAHLVVHLGTFSKTLAPGLRIGWVAAQPSLLHKYVLAKQGADLHTSTLAQMQIAEYIEEGMLDRNLPLIRELYRERRDAMIAALAEHLPAGASHTRPDGGLFLWVTLPPELDAREVLKDCIAEDVAFVPGGSFFPNGGHENTLRLNFSAMPVERITEGVKRLCAVLSRHLEGSQARASCV